MELSGAFVFSYDFQFFLGLAIGNIALKHDPGRPFPFRQRVVVLEVQRPLLTLPTAPINCPRRRL